MSWKIRKLSLLESGLWAPSSWNHLLPPLAKQKGNELPQLAGKKYCVRVSLAHF